MNRCSHGGTIRLNSAPCTHCSAVYDHRSCCFVLWPLYEMSIWVFGSLDGHSRPFASTTAASPTIVGIHNEGIPLDCLRPRAAGGGVPCLCRVQPANIDLGVCDMNGHPTICLLPFDAAVLHAFSRCLQRHISVLSRAGHCFHHRALVSILLLLGRCAAVAAGSLWVSACSAGRNSQGPSSTLAPALDTRPAAVGSSAPAQQ